MSRTVSPASHRSEAKGAPPSGGEAGTPAQGGAGGTGGETPRIKSAPKALPWYRCKRCGRQVLGYVRTRGIHNKKCPPIPDPVDKHIAILFP